MTITAPALRGTLDDLPLDAVAALLAGSGQTGALHFSGGHAGTVWFDGGSIGVAQSATGPTVRETLVAAGLLPADAQSGSGSDGEVGPGVADPDAVALALREQVVSTLFELLVAGEEFEFAPGETHPLARVGGFEVAEMMAAAEQRRDQWREIASTIPSTASVLALSPALPPRKTKVTVSAAEWDLVARLDGRATVAEVTRAVGGSAFDTCVLLHRLVATGLAVVADGPIGQPASCGPPC